MVPRRLALALPTLLAALLAAPLAAQPTGWQRIGRVVAYDYRLQAAANPSPFAQLVGEHVVRFPGASYLRLTFADVRLGEGGFLELRSLADGEVEPLTAATLARHRNVSAFFNGDAVRVRCWASPWARADGFRIAEVAVGSPRVAAPATLCDNDDRQPSADKRVGRILLNGAFAKCSAWLISSTNCFATAGHCFGNFNIFTMAVQFNVPPSDAQGNVQHPPVADQYQWMGPQHTAWKDDGLGDDWAVFKTHVNSVTNQHAGQVQGRFLFAEVLPLANLRLTGYGESTIDLTRNRVQQSDTGPLLSLEATTLRYRVDSTDGSSGCPVIDPATDRAVGIHTTGGCKPQQADSNKGTWIFHPDFVAAAAQLCSPPDFGTFDKLTLPAPCSGSGRGECEALAASLNGGGSARELGPVTAATPGDYLVQAVAPAAARICALELLMRAVATSSVPVAIYLADASGTPQTSPVRQGSLPVGPQADWLRWSFAPLDLGAGQRFFVAFTHPGRTLTPSTIELGTLGTHWLRTPAGQTGPHLTTPWAYRVLQGELTPQAAPRLGHRGFPTLGQGFDVELRQARPQAAAALIQGISSRQWGPLPLPFSLKDVGAPQCSLGASIEFLLGTPTDTAGRAALRIRLPSLPGLAGLHLYYQWLIFDPGANPLGLVLSDAGDGRIGR